MHLVSSCTLFCHAFSFIMHTVATCILFHHVFNFHDAFIFIVHFVPVPSCIWSNHAFGSIMHERCVICIPQASACLAAATGCITVPPCISVVLHCKKRLAVFPSLAMMSLTKLSLPGKNLRIPGQGEFGK
jgi:hypothetical protein